MRLDYDQWTGFTEADASGLHDAGKTLPQAPGQLHLSRQAGFRELLAEGLVDSAARRWRNSPDRRTP